MNGFYSNNVSKNILVMNDLPGYGRAALSVIMPVLAQRGYAVYNLPTALVSNTLDFGKYNILDTSDYMKGSLAVWEELGFSFDAVSVGYLASGAQGDFVRGFCESQAKGGAVIWVDPIMADNGKLYNGMGKEHVEMYRGMLSIADYTTPNYTEAALLVGEDYCREDVTKDEALRLVNKLKCLGARSIVITGMAVEGESAVAGYDHEKGEYFILPYTSVPGSIPGTGDIFLSLLMREKLAGRGLKAGVRTAMDTVKEWILRSKEGGDDVHGIPVEKYLEK